jgi:hypothetical protein
MSDLIASSVLSSAQIKQQLAFRDAADIVVRERRTGGVAICASGHGVFDGSTRGKSGLEVEVDIGCGVGSDKGVIGEGVARRGARLVGASIEKGRRRENE